MFSAAAAEAFVLQIPPAPQNGFNQGYDSQDVVRERMVSHLSRPEGVGDGLGAVNRPWRNWARFFMIILLVCQELV